MRLRPQLSTIHYTTTHKSLRHPPHRTHHYHTNTNINIYSNTILLKSSIENEYDNNNNDDDEEGVPSDDIETTQYYSPNVKLNEMKYRYDLENDNDTTTTSKTDEQLSSSNSNTNEYSFFDEAQIYIRAGSGGQGSSTYKRGPNGQNAQPDGGDRKSVV